MSPSLSLKTTTSILSPTDLAQSPLLPVIVKLINYTFYQYYAKAHDGGLIPPNPTMRLQSLTQLCIELEPDGFTMLMFSSDMSRSKDVEGFTTDDDGSGMTLIATLSAKPYVGPTGKEVGSKRYFLIEQPPPDGVEPKDDPDRRRIRERREQNDENCLRWEGLAMAVHPALQGRHIGALLLNQSIMEIKARTRAALSSRGPGPTLTQHYRQGSEDGTGEAKVVVARRKAIMMSSMVADVTQSYYLKRGFVTRAVRRYEPGTLGSRDGFSIADMELWIDCDDDGGEGEDWVGGEGVGTLGRGTEVAKL